MSECQLSCTDHCVLRNGQGGKGQPQTEQQDEGSGMRALDAVCIGEAMGQLVPLGGQSVETATDFQLRVAGSRGSGASATTHWAVGCCSNCTAPVSPPTTSPSIPDDAPGSSSRCPT